MGLKALERAREAERAAASELPDNDFVAKVRGGGSEVYKSGDVVHAMQGQCSGQEAAAWARKYAATTFKATFSEHGTPEAKILVRACCHRCQFFSYNIEMEAPAAVEFSYSDAHRAAYEEPTELTALMQQDTPPKWRKWMARIAAIHNIPRA